MRNLGLDNLRFLAVLLVLGRHLHLPFGANSFLTVWKTGGWIGVDLFFVLSGFLVSGLLFKEYLRDGKVDVKRFLIRRGMKIYPAFYVMIAITIMVKLALKAPIDFKLLLGELLFLQNYLGGLWNHTWSLAVEEHFYIGIAFVCFRLLRSSEMSGGSENPFRCIPLLFAIVATVCTLARIGTSQIVEFSYKLMVFGTHIRVDSLMFGVLLSYFWYFGKLESYIKKANSALLFGVGVLFFTPAFIFPLEQNKFIPVFGVILFYLGAGCLIMASLKLKIDRRSPLGITAALGACSYSVYLWHMPVASYGWSLMKNIFGRSDFVSYFLFYMIGSYFFGWVMSKAIEWPVLKLRDKLFPSSGGPGLSSGINSSVDTGASSIAKT